MLPRPAVLTALAALALPLALTACGDDDAHPPVEILDAGGGIRVGEADDAPALTVYGDLQCPWCRYLEEGIGEDLEAMIRDGEVDATFVVMNFLDERAGNDASTRAGNALVCAAEQDAFLPYYQALYAQQENGYDDEVLASLASDEIADSDDFTACLDEQRHAGYVNEMQEAANADGVTGTPRLFVDGEQVGDDELMQLIEGGTDLPTVVESSAS